MRITIAIISLPVSISLIALETYVRLFLLSASYFSSLGVKMSSEIQNDLGLELSSFLTPGYFKLSHQLCHNLRSRPGDKILNQLPFFKPSKTYALPTRVLSIWLTHTVLIVTTFLHIYSVLDIVLDTWQSLFLMLEIILQHKY